ncbi:hypothetical protein LDENG_00274450 [Lucifuga dentata]|nr:hypothetical protein LDENG_00274450 [Lucifuga dentata]
MWTVLQLLILMTLRCLSCAQSETEADVSCAENQKAFRNSCYEFVGVQYTFLGAQDWCEQNGGHLAFILNEETQHFLQRHLDAEKDWWLGVASTTSPTMQDLTTAEDQCQGRQVCQDVGFGDSLGESCPWLGSYLSVDYHCKEGLTVFVSSVAAVLDDVTITVKWLLHSSGGELSCHLSAGDGKIFHLHSPEG